LGLAYKLFDRLQQREIKQLLNIQNMFTIAPKIPT
jgi:hypothetical protein